MNAPRLAIQTQPSRFRLVPFDEIALTTTAVYLVKGLIPGVGLVVIWGPPKCGKSFWAFDMFMHVALGWDYRGRRVRQGAVVYLALEGAEGFRARAEAFRLHRLSEQTDPVPFHLVSTPVDLVADHIALIASIKAQLGEVTPCAVVVDTLNRSLAGSESRDEDMALYVRAADAIRDAFKCVVPIIHHSGIDATRPRGHTSLTGAADAQLSVKRDAAGLIVVELEWMKDGPEGATLTSRLEVVDVGTDEDGDPITSCVVVPVDDDVAARPTPIRKLSDRHKLALEALNEAVLALGAPPPAIFDLPAATRAVSLEQWREEMFRRGVLDRDAGNPREEFRRVRQALAARQLIGERDGLVWAG